MSRIEFPKSTGLTKIFYDEILAQAPRPNPTFAMAGAISLMSTLCSGRFKINRIWPSLFTMIIGEKSSGKNAPLDFCSHILTHPQIRPYNLLGQGNHNSKQSLVLRLPSQRSRLDLIDEYSGFLNNYQRDNSYARDAAMELTQIWSLNGRWYPGIKSVSRGNDTGECYGPSINVMALIQPEPFIEIASRDMIDTGYLSRFLFFYSDEMLGTNEDPEFLFEERCINNIASEIRRVFSPVSIYRNPDDDPGENEAAGLLRPRAKPLIVPTALKSDMREAWDYMNKKQVKGDVIDRMLYAKAFEQIMKVIIIKAVGDDRREISYDDIDWAYSLVETLISNSKSFIQMASGGSRYEKFLESARNFFREKKMASHRDYTRKFQRHERWERENAIRDLHDCENIETMATGKHNYYKWVNNP